MSGTTSPRVLVVEGDLLASRDARSWLAGLGSLEVTSDLAAALPLLAGEGGPPPGLVVLGLASGPVAIRRIRQLAPEVPVLALLAEAEAETETRRAGASECLAAPVPELTLAALARQMLMGEQRRLEGRQLREALALAEACRGLATCLDPGELHPAALDLLLGALARTRGLALYRRTSVPLLDAATFRGFSDGEVGALRRALLETKPVEIEGFQQIEICSRGPLHEACSELGLRAGPILTVPLRGGETGSGLLWIFADDQPFAAEALERAKTLSDYAALALRNTERYHRAKERAFVDDVTEVYNARYLLQATEHEIQRAQRYEKQLCVLFLDLDHFKQVNDQYGHLVGSQTLRQLSRVLAECIRQADTLARYGGDEFTILLADTPPAEGRAVAERIRRTVAETLFEGGRGAPIRLTISIGVACYPDDSQTREALLDLADKAMYRAKSLGRNCVCAAAELAV